MAKFLYHLQLYCIAWDSGHYESMTSTFYLHQGVSPTEIGTSTDFLASHAVTNPKTKMTCITPVNILPWPERFARNANYNILISK